MAPKYGPELYVFVGLSTEDKPEKAYAGQRAIETDTNRIFEWTGDESGGSWVRIRSNGVSEAQLSDQTTRAVIAKFKNVTNNTVLTAQAGVGTRVLAVDDATGFSAGKYGVIFDPAQNVFTLFTVVSVVSKNITIDSLLDATYPVGANIDIGSPNMNVLGTAASPVVFGLRGGSAGSPLEAEVDITRIIFHCIADTAVDLAKFADIAPLTYGLALRRNDGVITNYWNVKTNGEIAGIMYDWNPQASTNPVQGVDGFYSRLTFAGQSKIGVAVRLGPGEDLEILVQDDLTDITLLEITAEGHLVD